MATHKSARDLAQAQRGQAARLLRGMNLANEESAKIALAEAQKLAKGPQRTQKELAKAGHPFARNRFGKLGQKFGGKSLMQSFPLLPIGRNKGGVAGGFKIVQRKSGALSGWRVINTDPAARFVLAPNGTSKMVARGFIAELIKRVAAKVRAAHRKALREATR